MKKFMFVALLLLLLQSAFSQTYIIETSYGEEELVVPEGMTMEEAYKAMASLYLEERYNLENTLDELDKVRASYKEYIESVKGYGTAVDNYEQTVEDLEKIIELTSEKNFYPFWMAGLSFDLQGSYTLSGGVGMKLKNWMVFGEIRTPLSVGLMVGRRF